MGPNVIWKISEFVSFVADLTYFEDIPYMPDNIFLPFLIGRTRFFFLFTEGIFNIDQK